MGTKSKIVLTAAVSVVVTAVVTANATNYFMKNLAAYIPAKTDEENLYNKISMIDSYLDTKYLYDYDKNDISEKALSTYVESLEEPYTHYYTKAEFSNYMDVIRDEYVGIGVVVSANDNDEIEVVSATEGSPAYEAGILPNDIITAVDKTEYKGSELSEAVTKIKSGKEGEIVNLTIRRGEEVMEINVERRGIENESVTGKMLDGDIALVRISEFNTAATAGGRDTYTEFKDTVERLKGEGMKKLIIDLRDNGGGDLHVVCNIADMLLGEGTITYMEYKNGKRKTFSSDAEELGIPMVVMINGRSASASEVLTGALKDYKAAVVIGTKSYGKGIVQSVIPFGDGTGMSMTVAKYFSPSGVCIHGEGIEPDVTVKLPDGYDKFYASTIPEDKDLQLKAAVNELNK